MKPGPQTKSVLSQSNTTFLVAMGLIIVLGLVVVYSFARFSSSNFQSTAERSLGSVSLAIEDRLNFYQSLVDNIAARQNTQNILELGTKEDAQVWALEQRKLIPNAIGLALVDVDALILGDAGDLRVGPSCRSDLENYLLQDQDYRLRLHDDVPSFAHFDVVSEVRDNAGVRIGLVFASFSIDVLHHTLVKLSAPQSNVRLVGHNNELITAYLQEPDGPFIELDKQVADSDWLVLLQLKRSGESVTILGLISILFVFALVIITLMIILSRRQVTGLLGEFDNIRQHLDAVVNQDPEFQPQPARYRETESILPTIHNLSHALGSRTKYLSHLSETDQLTGLGNRRCFDEKIQYAWNSALSGNSLHLIYLDLDHFKACNDHYGHATGDIILKLFAQCLSQHTRQNDVLVRMGGDEFVVLAEGMPHDNLHEWYRRIVDCFAESQREQGVIDPHCTVSAGATAFMTDIGKVENVVRMADSALYQAKHQGRAQLVVHSPGP